MIRLKRAVLPPPLSLLLLVVFIESEITLNFEKSREFEFLIQQEDGKSRFVSWGEINKKRKERGDVKRKSGRGKSAVGWQKGRERNLADRAPVTGRRLTDVFQFARPFTDRQKRSLFCKLQIAAAVSPLLPAWKNASPAILSPSIHSFPTRFEIGNELFIFPRQLSSPRESTLTNVH